ncbi:MAG: hypothetical protein KF746_12960 [Chitinophagaceae bacterium]|nr:hypothetical protein [Chitinophagaceae bacterium]
MFFREITPLFAVCIIGIVFLVIQFFIPGYDYNIAAYLIIFIIFLIIGILFDRFLVSKIAYKTLFIGEAVFLVIVVLWYTYSISYTEINIETSKPQFFVLYNEEGLQKKDIPSKGLFSKSIVIKSDTIIKVNYDLYNKAQINPPESWNYDFSSYAIDTTIDGKKAIMQIYVQGGKMSADEQDKLVREEIGKIK